MKDLVNLAIPQLPAFVLGILSGVFMSFVSGYVKYFFDERTFKNERQRKQDIEILNRLSHTLRKKKMDLIAYLKEMGVTDEYSDEIYSVMEDFKHFCAEPENVFVVDELKKIQLQLKESVQDLYFYVREHSEHESGTYHTRIIFSAQRKEINKTLDAKTDKILANYEKLIESAKRLGL